MGLREKINENPHIATGATVGLILLAVLFIVWQLLPSNEQAVQRARLYFSDDDGATFFPDEPWQVPPFKNPKSGKDAVRAHVYRCGPNGALKVFWMEKYTESAKAALDKFYSDPKNRNKFPTEFSEDASRMIKKAGPDQQWKKWNFELFDRLRSIKCRETNDFAEEVLPPTK